MRLPAPDRSYAVLVGASRYHDADLPNLPAVSNNVTTLASALTNPDYGGFAADHCAIVSNPANVRAMYRRLRQSANLATDTLLVYFAGHGLLGPVKQDLYLALPDTDIGELEVSALPFDIVRQIFLNSKAKNRILILDCCFSGRAVHDVMATKTDAVLGQAEIAGTYTLASVPGNALSLAPAGEQFTVFTGVLLDLLNEGIPAGPELLSLGTV
ncbi:caspase family protein, partial [Amycolatopsis azurea]|uniref:Peptidase C14 caspase domain-containing protein n=1 Tax=Amycolatopsis azurea DSM 43854 TaxID=1238180 RepID=A0ABX3J7A1_9PSEU